MRKILTDVRGIMAMVVFTALLLGVARWGVLSAQYRRSAESHAALARSKLREAAVWVASGKDRPGPSAFGHLWNGRDVSDWRGAERTARAEAAAHAKAAARYRRAAARPWLAP